jgi:hypothetical protein
MDACSNENEISSLWLIRYTFVTYYTEYISGKNKVDLEDGIKKQCK